MRDGIGFGGVFLALLCALIVHDVLRLIVAALGFSVAFAGLSEAINRSAGSPAPDVAPLYGPRQPTPQAMERWAGPVEARQQGISRACINGYLADRNGNGWSDVRPRTQCIATSP